MYYTLITGSSFGLGLCLSIAFAKRGHNLILVSRKKDIVCDTFHSLSHK